MKKILVMVLTAVLVLSIGACKEKIEENAVVVSTVDEFMNAIEDDAVIYLEPGVYNLTEWIDEVALPIADYENEKNFQLYHDYLYVYDHVFIAGVPDGYEVAISEAKNLTIKSKDAANPATIIAEARCAQVLKIFSCENLKLENLYLGHSPDQGRCIGNVIECEDSDGIEISCCDLYGCGVFGLSVIDSKNISVSDSVIHDCSDGVLDSHGSEAIVFKDSIIENMPDLTLIAVKSSVDFDGCTFRNIGGDFGSIQRSNVTFTSCTFDEVAQSLVETFATENDKQVVLNEG